MTAGPISRVVGISISALVLPLVGGLLVHHYNSTLRWQNVAFHSTFESIASVSSLTLAGLLLSRIRFDQHDWQMVWVVGALAIMGVLDAFHATCETGTSWLWSRAVSTFVGGVCFALLWLPERREPKQHVNHRMWTVMLVVAVLAAVALLVSGGLCSLLSANHFSLLAKVFHSAGSLFFIAAALRLTLQYLKTENGESMVLSSFCMLMGVAAALFAVCDFWFADWWFCHVIRMGAYSLLLFYVYFIFRQTQESRRLNESRLEALWKLNRMTDAPLSVMANFALEEGVRLTNSKIGYLAFTNQDESVLTMYAWSRSAMKECEITDKPLVYPVVDTGLWGEAVRQRKAVITNDYDAPNPLKKGCPKGHVTVNRHMNVPIFDSNRIVAVAGVGNKTAPYEDSDVQQLTLLMEAMWYLIQRKRTEEELRKHHEHLEELVAARTGELQETNVRLLRTIAERTKVEQTLASQAKELARSNAELEQFAYVASHDLQEPLRMVSSYTQLLARRYKDKLDSDANEFIDYAVDGAGRMQRLISDLLEYARVNTRGKPFASLSFNEVLDRALGNLNAMIRETGATVTRGDLPAVTADATQMVQLMQNLLSNAIKFRSKVPPLIHVDAVVRDEEIVFSIKDNGIGIAREYFDRIFVIFQRLHSREEYPGTGIGLAVCKRIVDRHGGRIWVESTPGEGSIFHFSIPSKTGGSA